MILFLALTSLASAECNLRSLVTEIDLSPGGTDLVWTRTDTWRVEIGTGAVPCRRFELENQPGARVVEVKAVIRQPDDTRVVLDEDRLQVTAAGPLEARSAIQIPELRSRDRLMVRVRREPSTPTAAVRWRPGWRGPIESAALILSGDPSTASVTALEDGQGIALPTGARAPREWHWQLTDVPSGQPEPSGSDWLGAEWWVGVDGTLRDQAIALAKLDAVPAWTPPRGVDPLDWLDAPGPPLRVVEAGPHGVPPDEVWARGWGRPTDVARAVCAGLQGAGLPTSLVVVRLSGAAAWDQAAVVNPDGRVVFSTAPDDMFDLDGIAAGTGQAVDLPDAEPQTSVHLTTVMQEGESWVALQARADGPTRTLLGGGPIRLAALMPVLDPRDPAPRKGRLWTGPAGQDVWRLDLPGVRVDRLPSSASGSGPGTEWAASCVSDESGVRCAVRLERAGGWLDAGALPALGLVHAAVAEWASQTIEVVE